MSEVTDKWSWAKEMLMSRQEVIDRLNEFENMNPDDFYTNGHLDFDKIQENGLTHFVKSITIGDGKIQDFTIFNDTVGCVYLITSDVGLTKIGHTKDIEKRFAQIDNNSPCKIKLYHYALVKDAPGLEKKLHKTFGKLRIKGEWFRLKESDLEKAKQLIDSFRWQN